MKFTHIHVHSQYSLLDGAASVKGLVEKAKNDNMPAIALTDHGSMFGIKSFYDTCKKVGIKPIIGVEAYVARRGLSQKSEREDRSGNHLVILAKNMTGYRNLTKLCSISHIDGTYYRPRIDHELLKKYSEGLIISSACLAGEISSKIMKGDIEGAENTAKWYQSVFGDDYYLEVMRHKSEDEAINKEVYENQRLCEKAILDIGKKLNIKVIATNDVHFLNEDDAEAHDILICLNTGKDYDDPNRMRYTKQEWFKTTEEMCELFSDIPEVIENTQEISDKVEDYNLNSNAIMPLFPIPEDFGTQEEWKIKYPEEVLIGEFGENRYSKLGGNYETILRIKFESDYLRHITYEGAKSRWDKLTDDTINRIDFELDTIKTMGFPGYFLIVQDFIAAAREMDVIVGPGRGSAAGSVVAYCLKITNIDPIKHSLLFERFLNPDRISMPDIDIDFDDEGRQKVINWVTDKYGVEKVAHIITFGSMAPKMAIRDVARVLKLPLSEAIRLTKLVPNTPKMTMEKAFKESEELKEALEHKDPLIAKTMKLATRLDGSVRQKGVHACGILISRDPLTEHIPVIPTDNENLLTTQYDGHFVESIGLLKMDFLGLKTLSIIKTCIKNIKISRGIDIDIDSIPGDDKNTFDVFSRGETTGLFQFESAGMKKYLKELKPNRFEDLVAMNALYRPGPMEYIPQFIKRKHGEEPIAYDHPLMEEFLKDTYGITVYQEQVMLQSRKLGQFTKGMSDSLRKAMGKKIKSDMDALKKDFISGCKTNADFMVGCEKNNYKPDNVINKIWEDWEKFASYAFNKSHSVCYAHIAYQTGYLKAHYPEEFMASILSNNISNIEKVTTFMEECKSMGIEVLPPDINESLDDFTVNQNKQIRFGMAAIKGVGEKAINSIVEERRRNGLYKDYFDFFERIDYSKVNKKSIDAIICSGGLDGLGLHRAQYFYNVGSDSNVLDTLVNYGQKIHSDAVNATASLFGDMEGFEIVKPKIYECEEWSSLEQSRREKELIGIYLTSHPLDEYKSIMNTLCVKLKDFNELDRYKNQNVIIAGIIINTKEGKTKKNQDYGVITIEDFTGTKEIPFFGRDYIKFKNYFIKDTAIYVKGRVLPPYWDTNSNDLKFNVDAIELMSEIDNDLVNKITINIDINKITKSEIDYIYNNFLVRHNYKKKNNEEEESKRVNVSFMLTNQELNTDKIADEIDTEMDGIEFDNNEEESEIGTNLIVENKDVDKKYYVNMRTTIGKIKISKGMFKYFEDNDTFEIKIN